MSFRNAVKIFFKRSALSEALSLETFTTHRVDYEKFRIAYRLVDIFVCVRKRKHT